MSGVRLGIALLLAALALRLPIAQPSSELHVPRGSAISADGIEEQGEWTDAAATEIQVASDWIVRVRFKYDSENLYLAFEPVEHNGKRLFPEILIDPHDRQSVGWRKGQWWLHISNNLCEGNGEANVYERGGVFQCARRKEGWTGNNPPTPETQLIEVRVSFQKLVIQPKPGVRFGLAFDMTDATGDQKQKWFFWPSTAKLDSPKTWGRAVID